MDKIELEATTRETLGKKVRFLRRQGVMPVHLFGHSIKSETLQCDTAQLQRILTQAGKTRLISIKLDNDKKPRNVVAREVQRDPRTGELLHVDFYQVRMEEKIRVEVPIILTGEAPALKLKENSLVHELTSLTVECLPDEIPTDVEGDISSLTDPEQMIRVKDIALGEGVAVLNDPGHVVVRISVRHIEMEEEVAVEEGVEAESEAPEGAPPPGEEPKEE